MIEDVYLDHEKKSQNQIKSTYFDSKAFTAPARSPLATAGGTDHSNFMRLPEVDENDIGGATSEPSISIMDSKKVTPVDSVNAPTRNQPVQKKVSSLISSIKEVN